MGDSNAVTIDTEGATLTVLGGILSHSDDNQVTPAVKGRLNLQGAEHAITVAGSAYAGLDLQAQVSGNGGLRKLGGAALLLQGSNSFGGNLFIDQGVVDVRHNSALGVVVGNTVLEAGSLLLRNVTIGAENLYAEGQGLAGELPGSLLTCVGPCSWAGYVFLNTSLNVVGDITFTGRILGPGSLGFFGGGTSRLGGIMDNGYAGATLVRCPLLELAKPAGVKAFAGPLIVGGGAGGSAEARWLESANSSPDVTVLTNGLVNLNGHNEALGPLTFQGGTVQTGAGELAIIAPVTVNASAVSAIIAGNVRLPPWLTEFHVADGAALQDLLVSANLVGTGNLGKFGPGQMWLTGANTHSGATIVYEGTLVAASPSALGSSTAGTAVLDGATLTLSSVNGTLTESISINGAGVGGTNGALNIQGMAILRNQFPAIYACLDLATNAAIRVESGGHLTADGFISGTGPLIKTGAGTLVLSNANANT